MKNSEDELIGRVTKVLGNGRYEVELEKEGKTLRIQCYLSGRMRQYAISILVEDKVRLVLPPPFEIGRIVYREKV